MTEPSSAGQRGEPYPDWIRALDGKSGVYVIRELGPDGEPEIVYVGSSSAPLCARIAIIAARCLFHSGA